MNPITPRYKTRGRLPNDWDKMSFVNPPRRTPRTTIEAVMYAVRERGVAALKEAANIERLTRCDEAAKTEINERIAKLIAKQEIAA
jgi:hypothetical protein